LHERLVLSNQNFGLIFKGKRYLTFDQLGTACCFSIIIIVSQSSKPKLVMQQAHNVIVFAHLSKPKVSIQ
jgi:hypothetical protein